MSEAAPERFYENLINCGTNWLYVTGCMALSLLSGTWESVVSFGGVGAVVALIFGFGTSTARW